MTGPTNPDATATTTLPPQDDSIVNLSDAFISANPDTLSESTLPATSHSPDHTIDLGLRTSMCPGDLLLIPEKDPAMYLSSSLSQEGKRVANFARMNDGNLEQFSLDFETLKTEAQSGTYSLGIRTTPRLFNQKLRELHNISGAEWRHLPPGSQIESVVHDETGRQVTRREEILKIHLDTPFSGTAKVTSLVYDDGPGNGPILKIDQLRQDFELKVATSIKINDESADREIKRTLTEVDVPLSDEVKERIHLWARQADGVAVLFTGSSGNASPDEVNTIERIILNGMPKDSNILALAGNTAMIHENRQNQSFTPIPTLQDVFRKLGDQENVSFVGVTALDSSVSQTEIGSRLTNLIGSWEIRNDGDVVGIQHTIPRTDVDQEQVAACNFIHPNREELNSNSLWLAEVHTRTRISGILCQEHGYQLPILVAAGGGSTTMQEIQKHREMQLPIIYIAPQFSRPEGMENTAVNTFINSFQNGAPQSDNEYIVHTAAELTAAIRKISGKTAPDTIENIIQPTEHISE